MVLIYIALLTFYLVSLVLLLVFVFSAPKVFSVKRKVHIEVHPSDVFILRT